MLFQARRENKQIAFKRAESYAKEYLAKEQDDICLKCVAWTAGEAKKLPVAMYLLLNYLILHHIYVKDNDVDAFVES